MSILVITPVLALEIVTHPQVIDNNLTKSQLRRIYTMRQLNWSDNSAITVFVLPSQHALHQRFAKERLQIFPYQLNRIWHKLTYSGLGVAPTTVQSEEELIQAVIKTPGAIGYIDTPNLQKLMAKENDDKVTLAQVVSQENTVMDSKEKDLGKGVVNVVKIKD